MSPREATAEGAAQPQTEGQDGFERRRSARLKRAEEVKRKYDFSVIRTLRQQKGFTIEKFAKVCGLSYAPISRIETNLIKPNLETLDKIADGLGISTYNLVAMAERKEAQVQKGRDYRCGGFTFLTVTFEGVDIHLGEGKKGAIANDPDFQAKEFVTVAVRSGALDIRVNDKVTRLNSGDAICFDCVYPHQYVAAEDTDFVIVLHSRR